ncbi:unnamed protein product [Clavelina lepadiformis]|uniref:Uncharacterized protein n=1 Tax=Clavelina lepadiformis TaxID=159417 RepID=A0ABP0FY32_CLALP
MNSTQRNRLVTFPCGSPQHLNMREREAHLLTFLREVDNWTAYEVNLSFNELAEAGWYYTEMRDSVECWYCDGRLKTWEPGDEAWREHAKWFPSAIIYYNKKATISFSIGEQKPANRLAVKAGGFLAKKNPGYTSTQPMPPLLNESKECCEVHLLTTTVKLHLNNNSTEGETLRLLVNWNQ